LITKFAKVAVGAASFSAALMILKKELNAAYQASMKFNEGLSNVATLIPGNIARVEELKEGLKSMAVDSGKSLDDLTDGLYQVISAFGDTAETQERLNIVTKASIAGMSSTTDSLNLLSAVTKAYGDTSAQAMQKVSDLSFLTVKLGQTTFPELAGSMQQVTDSANRMGVSQEELFTAFATLTGVSGGASEVATQLRAALVALEGPSADLVKMYEELGVASGKALIEQYGFQGALDQVLKYSDKTGISLQSLLGRVQAMSAASNLAGSQAETYARKLGEIEQYAGATDIALSEVTDGIGEQAFALKQLKSQWEVYQTQIGDRIQPLMTNLIRTTSNIVGGLNEHSSSTYMLTQRSQDLIDVYAQYGGAIDTLLPKVEGMTEADEIAAKAKQMLGQAALNEKIRLLGDTFTQSASDVAEWEQELALAEEKLIGLGNQQENLIQQASRESKAPIGIVGISAAGKSAEEQLEQTNLAIVRLNNTRESLETKIANGNAQMKSDIDLLAKAVADEVIPLSLLALTNEDLYEKVKTASEALLEQREVLDDAPKSKAKTSQEMLDSFIGFNAKQLKEQLAIWQNAKETAIANSATSTQYQDDIIAGLKIKITDAEKEFVDNQKISLQYQVDQAKQTGQLGLLEVERLKTLADVNAEIGENADLTALINELFDLQSDKIKETYDRQLASQEFAIANDNELLAIDEQRVEALRQQKEEGLDTEANIQRINDLYDAQKTKILDNAEKELQWRVDSNKNITEAEKIELQRQKEIIETNKKYGEQADLIALINGYYDQLQIELAQNTSYYDKMEEAFRGAVGEEAYESLQSLQRAIVKTGEFIQGFSMIWNSLSSAMSAYYDLENQKRAETVKARTKEYEELRSEADEQIESLEDTNEEELEALEEMYDADAISYEDYLARKTAINDQFEANKTEANKKAIDAENAKNQAIYEADKAQFEIDRRTAISNAIIAGAQGIMQAWALGPIAGAIGSGIIAGATAFQVGQISQQPAPEPPALIPYAEGGIVTSPTAALIGEAGEPEAVIPLSKAGDYGFGGNAGVTYNITGNTFLGIDGVDELLIMLESRRKVLEKRGRL
jgi:TP901 family phage tail tape measure protein